MDTGLPLNVMPKPIGPVCNLRCSYCYYTGKTSLYAPDEQWRMSDETLQTFIRQYLDAQPPGTQEVVFGWQGGEPTLMGMDFYRRALDLQREIAGNAVHCINTIQTNGTLLDDAWCEFFRQNQFLVGLSIDGPAELHDRFRRDAAGNATHERVANALQLLIKHNVEHNTVTVVHRHNGSHPRRVYRFLRDQGVTFMQFIPLVERTDTECLSPQGEPARPRTGGPAPTNNPSSTTTTDRSILPAQWGHFLIEVFDEWMRQDVGRVFVLLFDQLLSAWMGMEPGLCIFRKQCGRALVLEHNGDVFGCDHFVDAAHRLGNIHQTPLTDLAISPEQMRFGNSKQTALPTNCRECEFLFACNGECLRNRFTTTPDGQTNLNYLCPGYKAFFRHADPYMRAMANELNNGRPAANVMQQHQHPRRKPKRKD